LCSDYGDACGLSVETGVVDLTETSGSFPADIIVLHNFLSYVPEDRHLDLIRLMAGWLKPGGRLLIWNNLVTAERRDGFLRHLDTQIATIKAMIEDGRMDTAGSRDALLARIERTAEKSRRSSHRVADTGSVCRLIALAGLNVLTTGEMHPRGLVPDPSEVAFPCAMVVAGRPA
jgi:hypothetical protein